MWFEYSAAIILEFIGRDAARYLHARLSNEIKNLPVNRGCLAGALTAQGKTEALYGVLRLAPERFICVCDGGDREAILAATKRFIVADRVEVHDRSATHRLIHVWPAVEATCVDLAAIPAEYEVSSSADASLVALGRRRFVELGVDLVTSRESAVTDTLLQTLGPSLTPEMQTRLRFLAAQPSFPDEIGPDSLLLESGLGAAVSFTKGCYVGQEVNERVDSRGKLPRRMVLLEVASFDGPAPGAKVIRARDQGVAGVVISSCFNEEQKHTLCFALLRSESLVNNDSLLVGDALATVRALAGDASR